MTAQYPDSDTFAQLLDTGGFEPYDVWRGVVARWLSRETGSPVPNGTWAATATWVRTDPEAFAVLLELGSAHFRQTGRRGLIVFDALDRTSVDWKRMDRIVRDLLRVILKLQATEALYGKVFLRDDQYSRTVLDFPDASKLSSTRVELTWATHDLHGLLWQRLLNAPDPSGGVMRNLYTAVTALPPKHERGRWVLSPDMRRDTPSQRALFDALAGPWMGRDRRRGVPYVWTVSHLADGEGRTSPRSFIAAIRSAAEDSQSEHPEHLYPLHFDSIKRGVQKASEGRVREIAEDFPWVPDVMDPLKGLTIPCAFADVFDRWKSAAEDPSDLIKSTGDTLPPQSADAGWEGIRSDLERLSVIGMRRDGRMDMPDLYRVGFGLGRKGGVKPMPMT